MANPLRLFFSAALLITVASADEIHDALPQYRLPMGLLPDSVLSYSLADNGDFVVELAAPCYVQFSYYTHFEKTIRGRLSYGAITNLSGIQVKKFLIWFSISSIQVDLKDNSILFSTGFISEKYPMKEFEDIRHCQAADSSRRARWFLPEELLPLPVSQLSQPPSIAMLEVFKQRGLVD